MRSKNLTLYLLFALISIVANIGVQEIVLSLHINARPILVSVLFGTATGLILKYILDKKYIFMFSPPSAKENALTFLLYTLMGVVTTGVFWSFEFAFDYFFSTKAMRYTGGVLGLLIGYGVKYHLDSYFSFRERRQ